MRRKENGFKLLIELFLSFFKVGLLTFGGGYAMIPIIQREVVEKRKWLSGNDILDILAISESTPGPIAVNAATYVGYRVMGVLGSVVATLALVIPSFCIIFTISLFYETFITWSVVNAAFKGLKVGVVILLFLAVIKLSKSVKKELVGYIIFLVTLALMLSFTFLEIKIPSVSIIFIASGLLIGVLLTLISDKKGGKKE